MKKKRSKLSEKAARIPDTRPSQWQKKIERYLSDVEPLNKESARSHRFAVLIQELLGVDPDFIEKFVAGIEQSLKVTQKDRILRGEADNLFGNVIIEFESNIPKKRAEAEGQVRRYTAILWSQESPGRRTPYLCIVTDGVRFVTYSPVLADMTMQHVGPDDVRLEILEEADWTRLKADEIFYWLDRYLCRKELLHPTSETIVRDFGAQSHAFATATHALLQLWGERKGESTFAVIFENWEKYLRIVYGSAVAGDELFIRHTYLATLAKLMAWMRITEAASLPEDAAIVEMLEGRLFKARGIENFIEEDFFSWLARGDAVKVAVAFARQMFSLLQNYNLRELSEDVLKSLYQQLVDPETRHDLGEYYTPDWLAHRIVRRLLDEKPDGSLLDPACGSGTFLYLAIKEKKERLGESQSTLRHILDSVCGADIHPLAVNIAKTNYILALGDLLRKRRGSVTIPIYLANTIRLPEREMKRMLWMQLPSYRVDLDGQKVHLPEVLLENLAAYDQAIELAKDFALQNRGTSMALESFRNFMLAQRFPLSNNEPLTDALFSIAETLKFFIDHNRDTIWAFILKNLYKPLFFKNRFDFVVGNPPWIAFRDAEPAYQKFLKDQITKQYKLLVGRGELITHLEVATLFLLRTADLYLRSKGTIAFVLPRSLFTADQHDGLRKRTFRLSDDAAQKIFWREIWDCEKVSPLFNVPSCVVMADKRPMEATENASPMTAGHVLSGKLTRRNASLVEAETALTLENVEFSLHTHGKRSFWATGESATAQPASFYKRRFFQGSTIVPRSFWFLRVRPSPIGFNSDLPPLETDPRAMEEAKKPYRDVRFEGNVESRFLYATLLSADLLPFGHLDYRLAVLPIEPEADHYKLVTGEEARKIGVLHLAQWLERAESEWTKRRGAKAERMTIYQRLDRVHGLTGQNPQATYRVIYNTSGTFLTAAVIRNEVIELGVGGQRILARGFVADHKTYVCQIPGSIGSLLPCCDL